MLRSLYTGVAGLRNHQVKMDVTSHNIANVNTTGYKAQRITFKEGFTQMLRGATRPAGDHGGINPMQIGLGMAIGSIDSIMDQGSLQSTGQLTDLAIEGRGFFAFSNGAGGMFYGRNGALQLNSNGFLVSPTNGFSLLGLTANAKGELEPNAVPGPIKIPFAEKAPASATTEINFACNLDADGVGLGTWQHTAAFLTYAAGENLLTGLRDTNGNALGMRVGHQLEISFNVPDSNGVNETQTFRFTVTDSTDNPAENLTNNLVRTLQDLADAITKALNTTDPNTPWELYDPTPNGFATVDEFSGQIVIHPGTPAHNDRGINNLRIGNATHPTSNSFVANTFQWSGTVIPETSAGNFSSSGLNDNRRVLAGVTLETPFTRFNPVNGHVSDNIFNANGRVLGLSLGDPISIAGTIGSNAVTGIPPLEFSNGILASRAGTPRAPTSPANHSMTAPNPNGGPDIVATGVIDYPATSGSIWVWQQVGGVNANTWRVVAGEANPLVTAAPIPVLIEGQQPTPPGQGTGSFNAPSDDATTVAPDAVPNPSPNLTNGTPARGWYQVGSSNQFLAVNPENYTMTMQDLLEHIQFALRLPDEVPSSSGMAQRSVEINTIDGDPRAPVGGIVIRGQPGRAFAISGLAISARQATVGSDISPSVFNANMSPTTFQTARDTAVHATPIEVFDETGAAHTVLTTFTHSGIPGQWLWEITTREGQPIISGNRGRVTFAEDGSPANWTFDDGTTSFRFNPNNGSSVLDIRLDVGHNGIFTGLTQFRSASTSSARNQNGYPMGNLAEISISENGEINGLYTNGVSRMLAQILLAEFTNPAGLLRAGDSMWAESNNSGESHLFRPGVGTPSSIKPGALEMSNVDLASEFTDLITTQRGYQANARVISTTDNLLQELVQLVR